MSIDNFYDALAPFCHLISPDLQASIARQVVCQPLAAGRRAEATG